MPQPLADVRVLDASGLISGPLAATMLADLGADVIKVEPESGDGRYPARFAVKQFLADEFSRS